MTHRFKEWLRRRARSFLGQNEMTSLVDHQQARIDELERELARVAPQVAGLETRVERLREDIEHGAPRPRTSIPIVPPDDLRSVREDLSRQQEQVRARISAAARFEERLRRVEEAVNGG